MGCSGIRRTTSTPSGVSSRYSSGSFAPRPQPSDWLLADFTSANRPVHHRHDHRERCGRDANRAASRWRSSGARPAFRRPNGVSDHTCTQKEGSGTVRPGCGHTRTSDRSPCEKHSSLRECPASRVGHSSVRPFLFDGEGLTYRTPDPWSLVRSMLATILLPHQFFGNGFSRC